MIPCIFRIYIAELMVLNFVSFSISLRKPKKRKKKGGCNENMFNISLYKGEFLCEKGITYA